MGTQGSPEDGVRLHSLKLPNMVFHTGYGDAFLQNAQTAAKLSSCTEDTQDAREGPPTRAWAHQNVIGSKMQENCIQVGAPRRSQYSQ